MSVVGEYLGSQMLPKVRRRTVIGCIKASNHQRGNGKLTSAVSPRTEQHSQIGAIHDPTVVKIADSG